MRDGSPQIEDGHIDIANETAEALARYRLSGHEYQVLWVIWRKTYGWHKKRDKISLGQIAKLTGMNRPGVARAVSKLVFKGVIKKDNSDVNIYEFNKHYMDWVGVIKKDNTPQVLSKQITGVIQKDNRFKKKRKEAKEKKKKQRNLSKRKKKSITPPPPKIFFNFSTEKWEGITKEDKIAWEETYPSCKIEVELKKMREWIKGAGANGHKKRWRRFINLWLSRQQDKGGTKGIIELPAERKPETPDEKATREKQAREIEERENRKRIATWQAMNLEELRVERERYILRLKNHKPIEHIPKDLLRIIKEKEKNEHK